MYISFGNIKICYIYTIPKKNKKIKIKKLIFNFENET